MNRVSMITQSANLQKPSRFFHRTNLIQTLPHLITGKGEYKKGHLFSFKGDRVFFFE